MSQKYILNKSKKLSFLVFFRPHLSVLASFLFWRSATRRAFRYIFARSLAKDAAPIPNALAAIKN